MVYIYIYIHHNLYSVIRKGYFTWNSLTLRNPLKKHPTIYPLSFYSTYGSTFPYTEKVFKENVLNDL